MRLPLQQRACICPHFFCTLRHGAVCSCCWRSWLEGSWTGLCLQDLACVRMQVMLVFIFGWIVFVSGINGNIKSEMGLRGHRNSAEQGGLFLRRARKSKCELGWMDYPCLPSTMNVDQWVGPRCRRPGRHCSQTVLGSNSLVFPAMSGHSDNMLWLEWASPCHPQSDPGTWTFWRFSFVLWNSYDYSV